MSVWPRDVAKHETLVLAAVAASPRTCSSRGTVARRPVPASQPASLSRRPVPASSSLSGATRRCKQSCPHASSMPPCPSMMAASSSPCKRPKFSAPGGRDGGGGRDSARRASPVPSRAHWPWMWRLPRQALGVWLPSAPPPPPSWTDRSGILRCFPGSARGLNAAAPPPCPARTTSHADPPGRRLGAGGGQEGAGGGQEEVRAAVSQNAAACGPRDERRRVVPVSGGP